MMADETFERQYAKMKAERERLDRLNHDVFITLQADLQLAELKHPVYAVSREEALLRVAEELGECAAAHNKAQGAERAKAEARDLLVVCWRLVREDWKEQDGGC